MKISKNLRRYIRKLTALVSVSAVLILSTVSPVCALGSSLDISYDINRNNYSTVGLDIYSDDSYKYIGFSSPPTDLNNFYSFIGHVVNDISNYYVLMYCSTSSTNTAGNLKTYSTSGALTSDSGTSFYSSQYTSGYYYNFGGSKTTLNSLYSDYVYEGTSLAACVDAFVASVPVPSDPVVQGYTSLEAGNIVYFDIGTNKAYDISMQSAFYSYSGVLSRSWADDNRRYGFVDELPTANTNLSESAGALIPWSPDASAQTIVGTSNQGVASVSGTTSGRYMWVINPLYNNKYYDDALSAKALNGLMKIYGVPSGTTVYTYKLKQSATSLGLDNEIPTVSGGVGTVSENEGQDTPFVSTDDNTTPYTQPVGGDTSAPETVTASEGIRQTLNQFVEMFNNLFTAPAEHIQHLIQAGQGFIQAITGLFSWMPSSVIDVFTSALVLMIVIGVLKMLL